MRQGEQLQNGRCLSLSDIANITARAHAPPTPSQDTGFWLAIVVALRFTLRLHLVVSLFASSP